MKLLSTVRFALPLACALLITSASFAQELTEREKRLLDTIESLEKRVTALEKQIENKPESAPSVAPAPATAPRPVAAESAPAPEGNDLRVYWKEGLRLDSYNGDFKLKLGGRLQNDWGWFSEGEDIESAIGNSQNGTEFRRARLGISGEIYEDFDFKVEYDFEDGISDFKDVYIAANNIPFAGTLTIGHFKEPFGLETLISSKDTSFMERSLTNAFVPERNTGFGVSNSALEDRVAWAVGVFRETNAFGEGQSDGGNINFTGRVSGLPIWNEEGDHYLHLGAAASVKNVNDEYAPESSAEAHMAMDLVAVPGMMADDVTLYGGEIAYVRGPFSAQGEYILADVDASSGFEDATFDAYYVMGSYFLTGEHRPYKQGAGVIDKIKPNKNFNLSEGGGLGAWELLAHRSRRQRL